MKHFAFLLPALLLVACTPPAEGGSSQADAIFEKNLRDRNGPHSRFRQ